MFECVLLVLSFCFVCLFFRILSFGLCSYFHIFVSWRNVWFSIGENVIISAFVLFLVWLIFFFDDVIVSHILIMISVKLTVVIVDPDDEILFHGIRLSW